MRRFMLTTQQAQYTYFYEVQQPDTLDVKSYLIQKKCYSSRLLRQIKREEGKILLNEQYLSLSTLLNKGDTISVFFPVETNFIQPEKIPLDIVYEDDEVLMINKDPFLVTHPTSGHPSGTLANAVAYYFKQQHIQAKMRFVSRLDQDTSGIVTVAKNKYVHHYIQSQMGTESVQKEYITYIHGHLFQDSGIIDAPIARSEVDPALREVSTLGKKSITTFQVLKKYKNASKVKINLITGRTHQIRVHMQYLGCPVIGDHLYADHELPDYLIKRQALHATKIRVPLPKKGLIEINAPLKEDLVELEDILERNQQ